MYTQFQGSFCREPSDFIGSSLYSLLHEDTFIVSFKVLILVNWNLFSVFVFSRWDYYSFQYKSVLVVLDSHYIYGQPYFEYFELRKVSVLSLSNVTN